MEPDFHMAHSSMNLAAGEGFYQPLCMEYYYPYDGAYRIGIREYTEGFEQGYFAKFGVHMGDSEDGVMPKFAGNAKTVASKVKTHILNMSKAAFHYNHCLGKAGKALLKRNCPKENFSKILYPRLRDLAFKHFDDDRNFVTRFFEFCWRTQRQGESVEAYITGLERIACDLNIENPFTVAAAVYLRNMRDEHYDFTHGLAKKERTLDQLREKIITDDKCKRISAETSRRLRENTKMPTVVANFMSKHGNPEMEEGREETVCKTTQGPNFRELKCYDCGQKYFRGHKSVCPAKDVNFPACGLLGHFESNCKNNMENCMQKTPYRKSRSSSHRGGQRYTPRRRGGAVHSVGRKLHGVPEDEQDFEDKDDDWEDEPDDETPNNQSLHVSLASNVAQIGVVRKGVCTKLQEDGIWEVICLINMVQVKMVADTGSPATFISKKLARELVLSVQQTTDQFMDLNGNKIDLLGKTLVSVQLNHKTVDTIDLYVVNDEQFTPIMGISWLKSLGFELTQCNPDDEFPGVLTEVVYSETDPQSPNRNSREKPTREVKLHHREEKLDRNENPRERTKLAPEDVSSRLQREQADQLQGVHCSQLIDLTIKYGGDENSMDKTPGSNEMNKNDIIKALCKTGFVYMYELATAWLNSSTRKPIRDQLRNRLIGYYEETICIGRSAVTQSRYIQFGKILLLPLHYHSSSLIKPKRLVDIPETVSMGKEKAKKRGRSQSTESNCGSVRMIPQRPAKIQRTHSALQGIGCGRNQTSMTQVETPQRSKPGAPQGENANSRGDLRGKITQKSTENVLAQPGVQEPPPKRTAGKPILKSIVLDPAKKKTLEALLEIGIEGTKLYEAYKADGVFEHLKTALKSGKSWDEIKTTGTIPEEFGTIWEEMQYYNGVFYKGNTVWFSKSAFQTLAFHLHNPDHRGLEEALEFVKKHACGFELESKVMEEIAGCGKCKKTVPKQKRQEFALSERELGQIRRQKDLCTEIMEAVVSQRKSDKGLRVLHGVGKTHFKPSEDPPHDVEVIYKALPYGTRRKPMINSQKELFAVKQFAILCINLEAHHHLLPYLSRRHQKLVLEDLKALSRHSFTKFERRNLRTVPSEDNFCVERNDIRTEVKPGSHAVYSSSVDEGDRDSDTETVQEIKSFRVAPDGETYSSTEEELSPLKPAVKRSASIPDKEERSGKDQRANSPPPPPAERLGSAGVVSATRSTPGKKMRSELCKMPVPGGIKVEPGNLLTDLETGEEHVNLGSDDSDVVLVSGDVPAMPESTNPVDHEEIVDSAGLIEPVNLVVADNSVMVPKKVQGATTARDGNTEVSDVGSVESKETSNKSTSSEFGLSVAGPLSREEKELENNLPADPINELPGHSYGGKEPRGGKIAARAEKIVSYALDSDTEKTRTEESEDSSSCSEEGDEVSESSVCSAGPQGVDFTKMSKDEILLQLNHMQGMFAAYSRMFGMDEPLTPAPASGQGHISAASDANPSSSQNLQGGSVLQSTCSGQNTPQMTRRVDPLRSVKPEKKLRSASKRKRTDFGASVDHTQITPGKRIVMRPVQKKKSKKHGKKSSRREKTD